MAGVRAEGGHKQAPWHSQMGRSGRLRASGHHLPGGGFTSRPLYAVILQAFRSPWMERGREKPCSPKGGVCPFLLMSSQDWRWNSSEMFTQAHQWKTGFISHDQHCLQIGHLCGPLEILAVGRNEWLCLQGEVSPGKATHMLHHRCLL